MGTIFQKFHNHVPAAGRDRVFVEIGSDRGEGSTPVLAALARRCGTHLITVDLLPDAKNRLAAANPDVDFVIAAGSAWAELYQGAPIAFLYLDNFDYIWDIADTGNIPIRNQMRLYADLGYCMTNQNCQIEHMRQILALYPHLAPDAVVAFDDTYCYNDCWIGKCGPAVVYLLSQGFEVVEQSLDCGVILRRS